VQRDEKYDVKFETEARRIRMESNAPYCSPKAAQIRNVKANTIGLSQPTERQNAA